MLLAPLPFDYVTHLDPHLDPSDRRRRSRSRPTGTRVRRLPAAGQE
ncbi:MAG TPA: hypothetical protein VJK66_01940 [Gaiellaceae bacterium]|nr:hypothetical protein [Gaiellaceae bacterium]